MYQWLSQEWDSKPVIKPVMLRRHMMGETAGLTAILRVTAAPVLDVWAIVGE